MTEIYTYNSSINYFTIIAVMLHYNTCSVICFIFKNVTVPETLTMKSHRNFGIFFFVCNISNKNWK